MKDSVCVGQRNDAGDERVVLFLQVRAVAIILMVFVVMTKPKNDDVDNQDIDHDHSDRGRTWHGS